MPEFYVFTRIAYLTMTDIITITDSTTKTLPPMILA